MATTKMVSIAAVRRNRPLPNGRTRDTAVNDLTDLETLICSLLELCFPNGYPAYGKYVPDLKTDEPFYGL